MSTITKILTRIVLLILLMIVLNYIYTQYYFNNDLLKHSVKLKDIMEADSTSKVLYLGESSNFTFSKRDNNKKSISTLASEYYPNIRWGTVSKGGIHAQTYLQYLKNISKDSPIETVIITLNMRSFNAQWIYSDLETSLQKEIVMLKRIPPLLRKSILSFKGYEIKTAKEREAQFKEAWKKEILSPPFDFFSTAREWIDHWFWISNGYTNPDGSKNEQLTILAGHYIKAYGIQLSENNVRLQEFDKIVRYANKRGWNLIFNLMAENTDKAQYLIGDQLIWFMRYNRDFLIERYTAKGVKVVNNLECVRDKDFIDQNWTTEHYREQGRKTIAKNLADTLKYLYANEYLAVDYPEDSMKILTIDSLTIFNDFESEKVNWVVNSSLSSEESFSGKSSSKIDLANPYSITYESYSIPYFANKLYVSAKVKTGVQDPITVVFELKGDKIPYTWNHQNISPPILNSWTTISTTFDFPETLKGANSFKVYLYNNTANQVFVDDISITLKKQ